MDSGFFIILDRLHGTLDKRMEMWRDVYRKNHGILCMFDRNRQIIHQLMVERLTVAYDLAAAFFYLHENRLVYRDIKPENIGFDIRGKFFAVVVRVSSVTAPRSSLSDSS